MVPRALVYLWAFPTTLVGLLFYLPTLISGGRSQVVDGVLELHGGFTRWVLRHICGIFLDGGASAMTLGHVVLGQDELSLELTRSHERVHVRQCERWGPFFLPAYGVASIVALVRGGHFYRDNAFEREAYETCGQDRLSYAMLDRLQQLQKVIDDAVRLHQAGRVAEAEQVYRQVLAVEPNHPDALHLLGLIAHHTGNREPARQFMLRAIASAPNIPLYHLNLAKVYRAMAGGDESIASARRAVELQPGFVEALIELSACLRVKEKFEEAETYARRALAHRAGADTHGILANALVDQGKIDEAMKHYQAALKIRPDWSEVVCNYGELLRKTARYEEAEKCFRDAIRQTGETVGEPHFNLAITLLVRGRFDEGWDEYEYRWKQIGYQAAQSNRPVWDGSNLDGRTLLLYSEQGLGDSIQFIRYAPMIRDERGGTSPGRVIVTCEPPLVPLLKTVDGVAGVYAQGAELPSFDLLCPIASLPQRFRTKLETIPARVPYVSFDPARAARWREELKLTRDVKNVGLVWAGSAVHKNDRNRSCRLADFAPLADMPRVRFFSLQMGPQKEQLASPPTGLKVEDATAGIRDFSDSAALLAELDLLISVDTAPAHLAGALARPVWTVHPFVPDFRWLLERSDSPWYPTMRVFRQPAIGDWAGVMREMAEELRSLVLAPSPHPNPLPEYRERE